VTVAAARLRAWLPLLPALLVVAVWLPSLAASFQFDDYAVIVDDGRVQTLAAWWQSLPGIRPLLKLSYALGHAAGAGVVGFRAVNILLHALNSALVFVLLRRLARRFRVADEAGAAFVAATAALVFALHPAQTESVTYLSGRSNLLMASFVLLALLAFTARGAAASVTQRGLAQLATLAGIALAMASKEVAVVAPLALLLIVRCEHGRGWRDALAAAAPSLGLALLLALAGLLLLPYGGLMAFSLELRDPWTNLLTQARGIGWLAEQVLRVDQLNADPQLAPVAAWDTSVVLTGLALLGVLALGVASLRQRPGLAFGILWCFLWLAPTNSLVARLDVANDRQLYLPLMGLGWMLGLALLRVPDLLQDTALLSRTMLVGAIGLALAAGTISRNAVYRTEATFWQDVVAKSPRNARAANNLGMAHALACEPLAARSAFERAAAIAPDDPLPQVNLVLLERGELPGMPSSPACR
jgi:hypothetical protein